MSLSRKPSATTKPPNPSLRRLALVLAGGFCGTLARYYLAVPLLALAALAIPSARTSGFPFDIFAINLSGAFALGLLYGLAERGARVSPDVRLALGTGFLGAYTTFSTFTVGGDRLLVGGAELVGVAYLAGSLMLGVLAAHLGHAAAGALVARRRLSRRVRVRVRRVRRAWHTTFSLTVRTGRHAGYAGHAASAQPWRLAHRVTPRSHHARQTGHASQPMHPGTHAGEHPSTSNPSLPRDALGTRGDGAEYAGYTASQEEEER